MPLNTAPVLGVGWGQDVLVFGVNIGFTDPFIQAVVLEGSSRRSPNKLGMAPPFLSLNSNLIRGGEMAGKIEDLELLLPFFCRLHN